MLFSGVSIFFPISVAAFDLVCFNPIANVYKCLKRFMLNDVDMHQLIFFIRVFFMGNNYSVRRTLKCK